MLPPETTATILLVAGARRMRGRPRGGDGARGRAFDDDVAALGGEPHRARPRRRARRRSTRSTTGEQQRPHRRQHGLAAGAVHPRRASSRRSASARRPRATPTSGAAVSGSAAYSRASGRSACSTQPMPASRPPPPIGAIDGVHVRQVLEDLERRRAVAADEVVVVERMHEAAGHAVGPVRLDGPPAFVVRRLDDGGAEALDGGELGGRRACP